MNKIEQLVEQLKQIEEIEGVFLGGSRTTTYDHMSDYDVYCFVNERISLEKRQKVIEKVARIELLGSRFWGDEDHIVLNHSNINVDVIYWKEEWITEELNRVLERGEAKKGYTTCFWYTIMLSIIVFDRRGKLQQLVDTYRQPYPQLLKRNILASNVPILRDVPSSYRNQIQKAISRGDRISVQHRATAFLASYFDVLFAINEQPHPGEKRMIAHVKCYCNKVPAHFERNIEDFIQSSGELYGDRILYVLDCLVDELEKLIP